MTLLRLSAEALSRSRFALSPLAETVGAISMLSRPCSDPWLMQWHARHRPAFDAQLAADPFARGFVRLLTSTKWLPDVVAYPPRNGMRTTLASELRQVRSMSDAQFRSMLILPVQRAVRPVSLRWLTGSGWAHRVATLIDDVWSTHVHPDWPRRRALLERDVMHRAGLLAAYGWPRALDRMTKWTGWEGSDAIRFSNHASDDMIVGRAGMVFVPVSSASGTWLCEDPQGGIALVYPARGTATDERRNTSAALDRLMGRGRARILLELDRAATSTELAAALELSLGTVGGHLTVLRDAGLVAGARIGRRVVYRRTEAGDSLVGTAAEGSAVISVGPMPRSCD